MHIGFNRPCNTGNEKKYLLQAIRNNKLSGDSFFGKKCESWFEEFLGCHRAILTPSCTASLEMAAILIDLKPGDEVIMPSYTFVSTANAFVLRGAKIIYVDIRPDTMNIDENKIENAINPNTKAIVVVHYAGIPCEMDQITKIAKKHNIFVIEDAAQGMQSTYKNKPLGTIGHMGTYSFHETKNYTSGGEGGLLIINKKFLTSRAEIIREKGTNRSKFFRGQVDKYTWVDIGSSYLPSELQAAYLWGQLEKVDAINQKRLKVWQTYYKAFKPLEDQNLVALPTIPKGVVHNAHMFYLKLRDLKQRSEFIKYLSAHNINSVFHYIPLHSSPAGMKFGEFFGRDEFTTSESERIVRLPLFYSITSKQVQIVIKAVKSFLKKA